MAFEHDYDKFPELTNRQIQELQFTSPHKQIVEDFTAVVVKVHDADTITLRTDFRDFNFPLRLLDIDAPELNEGGEAARDWLKARIHEETIKVMIDRRQRVGKYGRLLGKVFHKGMDVGQEMLSAGMVVAFGTKDKHNPQPLNKIFRLRQWL